MNKRDFLKALGATVALPGAVASAYAARPIRMIVPLPAGTQNDMATRVLAAGMGAILGQAIVVENKPGGNGIIATTELLRAKPDGLTLMCGSNSPLAANVAFVKNLPYNPKRDFTPIAGITLTNHVLLVKSSSPYRTLGDFIAAAKQRPGKLSVGASTSAVQVQIAAMSKLAGIQLLTVPYKGTPATITDVIGGVLDATLTDPGNAMSQVRGGHLRALGVTSLKRNPVTPEWPAIAESLPGFAFPSWNAVVGPAGMARPLVERIHGAIVTALKDPAIVARLATYGTTPLFMGPDELKNFMASETDRWVRLARDANIQPE